MKLLITTQVVDSTDSNLGFFVRWIEEFAKHCEKVTVICLRSGTYTLPQNVEVYTLGTSRFMRVLELWRLSLSHRNEYDAVFAHMNPEYIVAAGVLWRLLHKRITLWYTHKSVHLKLRIATALADTIFTASKESFRLKNRKVHVMGHGIDTTFFSPDPSVVRGEHLLSVGRLSKSKRHDVAIHQSVALDKELRIAGEGPERSFLEAYAKKLNARVTFLGGLNALQLRDEYRRAAALIHTSETGSLDKVVLEALACGLPIRTQNPALKSLEQVSFEHVREHHSLAKLIPALYEILHARKILFLFTTPRNIEAIEKGEEADTQLRGMNYIPGAEYMAVPPTSLLALRHLPALLTYDFVIAQDHFLLGYLTSGIARLLRISTQWLYVTIHSSTLLRRYARDSKRLFLLRAWWRSYARIICVSHMQMQDLVTFGIPHEKLSFLPFGIDADFFARKEASKGENLIVSVGRDQGRDYATLFEALKKAPYPTLIIASKKNISATVPAQVTVEYDKSLSYVRDVYTRARMVVVPSKEEEYTEGSDCSGQTVILDALAAGKAVIATQRTWIDDYFIPGEDLVTVPAGNAAVLAEAIQSLFIDEGKQERISRSGQSKVKARYTTKMFAHGLQKIMETCV